jgi:hypothetical protein
MAGSHVPTPEDVEALLARARRTRSEALGSLIFRAVASRPAELMLLGLFAGLLAAALLSEPKGEAELAAADTILAAAHANAGAPGSVFH